MYIADLSRYVPKRHFPLYVESVKRGEHPERMYHVHKFTELIVILHGTAVHWVDEATAPVRKGDVLLVPPNHCHAYEATDDLELVNVVYDHSLLSMPLLDGHQLPLFHLLFPLSSETGLPADVARPVMRLDDAELKRAAARIRRLRVELTGKRPGGQFFSLTHFMELVIGLARSGPVWAPLRHSTQFLVGAAIRHIQQHCRQPLAIGELAKATHMSERNFFRQFKKAVGCTPQAYLTRIRLQKAAELLERSDLGVGEIAHECGFVDGSHLTRLFRKARGVTPRRYRERHRVPMNDGTVP